MQPPDSSQRRTTLQRQLRTQQQHADRLLAEASLLNGVDSFPIELLFPLRQGRSKQQIGTKSRDKGRWSIGVKVCWILNTLGQVVGWHWLTMNRPDQDCLPLVALVKEDGVVLSDLGFRCKTGVPDNLKVCLKGTWNDRMMIETTFSLLTVICQAKKRFHRTAAHLEARLAYTAAGNWAGTDATGMIAVPNGFTGIALNGATVHDSRVGGSDPAARNILSGNLSKGVEVANGAMDIFIQGNWIGVDATGQATLGSQQYGMTITTSGRVTVGGTQADEGNIIAYNSQRGLSVNAPNLRILGNWMFGNGTASIYRTNTPSAYLAIAGGG
jgi:hypothetical protein